MHKNTKLVDFAEQYCNAMEIRANSDKTTDANSSRFVRKLEKNFEVKKVFQGLQIDAKFKEVQAKCLKMLYVECRESR